MTGKESDGGQLLQKVAVNALRRSSFTIRPPLVTSNIDMDESIQEFESMQYDTLTPSERLDVDSVESVCEHSPLGDHIARAGEDEEKEIDKCKTILQTMKKAVIRQKNISIDVKKGIELMEESLDVITSIRESWKMAESCRSNQQTQTTPNVTPVSSPNKRQTSGSSAAEWSQVVSRKEKRRKDSLNKGGENPEKKEGNQQIAIAAETKKTEQRVNQQKVRPVAILIKPQGKSYAEILKELRLKVKPEETETEIKTIR
ncbi:hypothetical protein QE152_g38238 [Popillia japonica]|uniref:Phosphoprotein n=1 Tax=Popillia japonica TaxID=7064 RepID=A0AAW1I750_POPJA